MAAPLAPCAVHQLDAQQLDVDIMRVLGAQWRRIFAHCRRPVVDALEPERDALLRLLVWRFTHRGASPRTPGQQLQNLAMEVRGSGGETTARARARASVLELLFAVLAPWLLDRLRAHASARGWAEREETSWRHRAWRLLNACEGAGKVLQLAATLSLLRWRRPYAPHHLLTGMTVGYASLGSHPFSLAFELIGQQLAWAEGSELAQLCAMLAPSRAAVRALGRRGVRTASALLQSAEGVFGIARAQEGLRGTEAEEEEGRSPRTAELRCAECHALPASVPCHALSRELLPPAELLAPSPARPDPCLHVHCYTCLSAALQADSHHACRVCARRVRGIARCVWTAESTSPLPLYAPVTQ